MKRNLGARAVARVYVGYKVQCEEKDEYVREIRPVLLEWKEKFEQKNDDLRARQFKNEVFRLDCQFGITSQRSER